MQSFCIQCYPCVYFKICAVSIEMEKQTASEKNDEDEVVFETDVFLSKALSDKLYVFHYPSRSTNTLEEESECISAKIKPKQKKMELEFGLNIHSTTYDKSRGEQIAYNVDGQNPSGEPFFQSSMMDKFMLTGTKACNSMDSYAVGFLRKGELHITPVHAVMELRPGFTHMDQIDRESKKALNPDVEEDEEAVAVTVRFEGPNADKERQIRQKSYQYLQQKNASEAWIDVNYHKFGSSRSISESEKLMSSQRYKDSTNETVSPQDYLKHLVPDCLRLSGCDSVREEETAFLSNKPLSDQIRHLMINAHVLRFPMLLEKLPPGVDILSVERLVQQIAVLVQGCWAVKSDLLYTEDSISLHTGISSKLLINARDYLLWLFTKSKFITREEVLSATYVPNEDFKVMINPIANRTNRGWEFKYPFDTEFIESHPTILQGQDIKWNLRYKKLVKDLNLGMCDPENEMKPSLSAVTRPKQKRLSRSSISEGDESGTDSASGNKDNKAKRAYIPKKRSAMSPTKPNSKSKPFHIATLDISPTFLESSPPEAVKAELRDYVGDVIRAQYCMTLNEMKDLVFQSPLNSIALRSDFQTLLEEALIECGAQKLKNKWPQNTSPEILYAFTKYGNKLDRYRAALLDLFSTTARARTNFFVKKVEDELREKITEPDCRQIFEEYCVYKSGFYYLKGTIALDT